MSLFRRTDAVRASLTPANLRETFSSWILPVLEEVNPTSRSQLLESKSHLFFFFFSPPYHEVTTLIHAIALENRTASLLSLIESECVPCKINC